MSGVLGGGGSGWNVAADINFADEPSQTLASDGNYTIGGVTWSKINSASDATPMAIVNGTGLVITPNQASDFGTVRTIPAVVLPLASVIPRFWLGMRVRCWMYIAAENCAADLDGVLLLLERGTLATQWLYSGGGIVRWGAAACVASIAGLAPTYATFKTAPKQDVVVVDHGRFDWRFR